MSSTGPIIYVVEDDDVSRALVQALASAIDIKCKAFDSAATFLQHYDPRQPGCVVLDLFMPGMSGLELQNELNRRGAVIPVIFITGHADVPSAVEAMRHGAFNYLLKPFRNAELIDNVQRALELDRRTRESLQRCDAIEDRMTSLTRREREVLNLVTRGCANKVIAHDLGVSERTVELHRSRLMEKMAAGSVAQLVRMFMDFERRSEAAGGSSRN
jgi:two-component system, LuxR family, response regulator FixJ